MPPTPITTRERRSADRLDDRTFITFAAAARDLGVSETTLRKWIGADLVNVTLIGPPGFELKRIARDELRRLQRVA